MTPRLVAATTESYHSVGSWMADIKSPEAFGLDPATIKKIDWELSRKRILSDVRSDFVYAPHLNFIYARAGSELIQQLTTSLASGKYSPSPPVTIEVPKSFRIRVASPLKRLGPSFSRPGSILLPSDRVLYQALADEAAPIIDAKTDTDRSFSHRLAGLKSPTMFTATRTSWNILQERLRTISQDKRLKYIIRIDVANFFGSINQHILINTLNDASYPKALSSRLEALLISLTGERSSRGIVQGIYPSDLFGNFYLTPVDRFFEDNHIPSARYVDDLYVFVPSVDDAENVLRELIPLLRGYDLVLNEAKSSIIPKASLITEEPDLESLFQAAVTELSSQLENDDLDAEYGFQSEWEDTDESEDEEEDVKDESRLELEATKLLFESISDYPGHEENIERFCLPLFARDRSAYALDAVKDAFKKRPAMAQIYAAYLAKFISEKTVKDFLIDSIKSNGLADWQEMWMWAALSQAESATDEYVKVAFDTLKNTAKHDALRAVTAIYVGRFGDHIRRKSLISIYPSVSSYVQAAIFFSSRGWPTVERSNAKANWGGHGTLNPLIAVGLAKKNAGIAVCAPHSAASTYNLPPPPKTLRFSRASRLRCRSATWVRPRSARRAGWRRPP